MTRWTETSVWLVGISEGLCYKIYVVMKSCFLGCGKLLQFNVIMATYAAQVHNILTCCRQSCRTLRSSSWTSSTHCWATTITFSPRPCEPSFHLFLLVWQPDISISITISTKYCTEETTTIPSNGDGHKMKNTSLVVALAWTNWLQKC